MSQKVIDLRKANAEQVPPSRKEGKTNKSFHEYAPEKRGETLVQWRADEYQRTEYGQYWFVKIGAAAVVLVILGIFTRSYFFIAFVALAFIVIVMYAKRPPRAVLFFIEKKGVRAGKKLYAFGDLKSFWISDTHNGESELSLETTHMLQPFVRLPLGAADTQGVRRALLRALPEKEHEELFTDQIARKIGF